MTAVGATKTPPSAPVGGGDAFAHGRAPATYRQRALRAGAAEWAVRAHGAEQPLASSREGGVADEGRGSVTVAVGGLRAGLGRAVEKPAQWRREI